MSAVGSHNYCVVTDIKDIRESYDVPATICSSDYYALEVYFRAANVKVVGFDNIKAIDKYKIDIDSIGYSMTEIANEAVNIIKNNGSEDAIVAHHIVLRSI